MEKKNDSFIPKLVGLITLLLPIPCFASGHIPSFSLGELLLALLPFPTILILSFFVFGLIRMRSRKAGMLYFIQFILTAGYYIQYCKNGDGETIDGWLLIVLIPLAINTILFIINLIWKDEQQQGQEPEGK